MSQMLHNNCIRKEKDKQKLSRMPLVSVPSVPQDHQPILYAAARLPLQRIYEAKKPSKNGLIKVVPLPSLEAKKKSKNGQEPLPALKSLSRVMSPRTPPTSPKRRLARFPVMPQTPLVKGGHQGKSFVNSSVLQDCRCLP